MGDSTVWGSLVRVIVAVVVGLNAVSIASAPPDNNGPPPAPVVVRSAVSIQLAPVLWVAATVIGNRDVRLALEVAGRLREVLDVGSRVKPGEVLARVESLIFELNLRESEAVIARIEARRIFAAREATRLAKLAARDNAAKNRLDEVRADRDVAKAERHEAEARRDLAADRLAKTTLRAPFAGVVTERIKASGEWVEEGDEVLRFVDPADLEISAQAPLAGIAFLAPGATLKVSSGAHSIDAEIRVVVPVGDDVSHLYELRLRFSEPTWVAGQVVRVAVPVAKPRQVIAVPRDALVIRRDGILIYRIGAQGVAEQVPVQLGISNGDPELVEVIGQIKAGDRVVVRGNERLRPGQNVTVIPNS